MTEPDDLIRDEADLFQALECADWHDVQVRIDEEVEPLEIIRREVLLDGFVIEIYYDRVGTEFRMTYPFTASAFWQELSEVAPSAEAD